LRHISNEGGNITVKMELQRMWKEEVLAMKSKDLKGEEVLSKEIHAH